jgi:flagellar biosynthesis/type III secretory pathway chaperone
VLPDARTLAVALEQQEKELSCLLLALEHERELLCSAHPDGEALLRAAEAKTSRLDKLRGLDASIAHAQRTLGFPAGIAGREDAAEEAGCSETLQRVLEATRRVYRLNGINGKLVEQRLGLNRKILEFMRDAQGAVTYGATGKATAQRSTISSRA